MKQMKTWLQHLRQCCALKGRKTGSSLGMVMIVGTALVIWVMAIMPLMTTTGTTAIKTQSTQDDYLTARSSIEFSKSELEKIVETQIPYTFAVLKDDSGKFSALPKKIGVSTNGDYLDCVDADATEDMKDVPKAGTEGNNVVAICAVESEDGALYDILITTFTNGEKNLTYSATYQVSGSLLIYPEAYEKNQALPLSDFVLVDGKLGADVIWNSGITSATKDGVNKKASWTEELLPWLLDPEDGYADAGEYPAVFKGLAEAASTDDGDYEVDDPVYEAPFTNQNWIMPFAVESHTETVGAIWATVDSNNEISVFIWNGTEAQKISGTTQCTVYYNGSVGSVIPKVSGTYMIAVDYEGTGEYKEDSIFNVLPIHGLNLGNFSYQVNADAYSKPICKVESANYADETFDVTLTDVTGAIYGWTDKPDGSEIKWTTKNQISDLDSSKTYYFYCYMPAGFDSSEIYHAASEVVYAGMVFPFDAADSVAELESGAEYYVMTLVDDKYYSMTSSLAAENYPKDDNNNEYYAGEVNGGVIFTEPQNDLEWTLIKTDSNSSNSSWQITKGSIDDKNEYKASQWLNMTRTSSWYVFGTSYTYKLSLATTLSEVKIDFVNEVARISKEFDRKELYESKTTGYVTLNSNKTQFTTVSGEAKDVYFVKVPISGKVDIKTPEYVANLNMPNLEVTYSVNNWLELINQTNVPDRIYANGNLIYGIGLLDAQKLNAGVYELIGCKKIELSEEENPETFEQYYTLGTLEVTKDILPLSNYKLEVEQDNNDELLVTVTGEGWACDSYGNTDIHYFGYKIIDEDESDTSEYKWFATNVNNETPGGADSYTFRLDYGRYKFAIAESDAINCMTEGYFEINEPIELEAETIVLESDHKNDFRFTFSYDATSGSWEVIWYELPEKVLPSKVTLVFGYPTGAGVDDIEWRATYDPDTARFFGALVKGATGYEALPNAFRLEDPIKVTNVNGHCSSTLTASSIYFMNGIDTHGNNIYLTTDLLVIKDDILHTGGTTGQVYLSSYSKDEDGDAKSVLVFFVNAVGQYEAKTFYKIPSNVPFVGVENTAQWKISWEDAKYAFRQNQYPEINLDIAYADDEQLLRIVSGEIMGWTTNGVLAGEKANVNNQQYAVCPFITSVSGDVVYKANRILLAAKTKIDGSESYSMVVPGNITFSTRYLSLDVQNLLQGESDATFVVHNLAMDESFFDWIVEALGCSNFSSKTLQIEYERLINIIGDGTRIDPQIYRYEEQDSNRDGKLDGINLFTNASDKKDLMAVYTNEEMEELFDTGGLGSVSKTIKVIDRYLEIAKKEGGSAKIDVAAWGKCNFYLYANYIYIDSDITDISVANSWSLAESNIYINSQESGYTTDKEYLGLFVNHSAENYNGTLIYVAGTSLKATVAEKIGSVLGVPVYKPKTKAIDQGFYFIPATDNGTGFGDLADCLPLTASEDARRAERESGKPFRVAKEELSALSVYINPNDGTLSNAYVDTGIYDSEGVGMSGFTGGSVK